jgi:hypothetical protein
MKENQGICKQQTTMQKPGNETCSIENKLTPTYATLSSTPASLRRVNTLETGQNGKQ